MGGCLAKRSNSNSSVSDRSTYSVDGSGGDDTIRQIHMMMQKVRTGTLPVNTRDAGGRTPLMWCCRAGLMDDVQYLLSHGADIRMKDSSEWQAIHWSTEFPHSAPAVRMLIRAGADVNALDNYRKTPLHWAAGYENVEVVRELLQSGASVDPVDLSSWTPLHWACWGVGTATMDWLLKYGADINAVDAEGYTALCWAVYNETPTVCRYLLENGADLGVWDSSNSTALHWAASYNKLDMVRTLLLFNADVGARSPEPLAEGGTPLDIAIEHENEGIIASMLATPEGLHSLFR